MSTDKPAVFGSQYVERLEHEREVEQLRSEIDCAGEPCGSCLMCTRVTADDALRSRGAAIERAEAAERQVDALRKALARYVPVRRPPLLREDGAYLCLQGVDPESHRTCGSRSWSHEVSEWCSASAPCSGCESPNGDLDDLRAALDAAGVTP